MTAKNMLELIWKSADRQPTQFHLEVPRNLSMIEHHFQLQQKLSDHQEPGQKTRKHTWKCQDLHSCYGVEWIGMAFVKESSTMWAPTSKRWSGTLALNINLKFKVWGKLGKSLLSLSDKKWRHII